MTDASPRIFRNLEKSGGRDSFDTIVLAAAADFAALERPSAAQIRDFGRLVLPLYERTGVETRRLLATSLAASRSLPRPLVERFLGEAVAVSAPFLLASPLLTDDDLTALAKRREAGLKKVLKARADAAKPSETARAPRRRKAPSPAAPAAQNADAPAAGSGRRLSAARQTALLSAGTPAPVSEPPRREPTDRTLSPDKPVGEVRTAEEALFLLRRLALAGRGGDTPARTGAASAARNAASRSTAARPDLMGFALDRDEDGFYSLLANRLLLEPDQLAAMRDDETGRELAAGLRALGAERADALTMLMMLKASLGSDVPAFEAMGTLYASLDQRECAARFDGTVATKPALQPAYAQTETPHRAGPRPAFGRRTSLPNGIGRRQRNT